MNKNMIDELICASPNRRSFLKTVGVATAAAGALALTGAIPAVGCRSLLSQPSEAERTQF